MNYTVSAEEFKRTFGITDENKKLTHHSGSRNYRVFPFLTSQQSTSPAVESLNNLVGNYLSLIEGIVPKSVSTDTLLEQMEKETKIESGREELFRETVSQLFFERGQLRSLNLKMREYVPCTEPAEQRIVQYLVDVLGDRNRLQTQVKNAMNALTARSNVLERFLISKLEVEPQKPKDWTHYEPVTTALRCLFEQDFEYILRSEARTRDYLLPLLEFYYFAYTAQACLLLERLYDGEPESNSPLYFSLAWEKTSQNRMCYEKGWKRLEGAVTKLFVHAITLEILNQTEENERFDYVKLARMADRSAEEDVHIAGQIRILTTLYRNAITDSQKMNAVVLRASGRSRTAAEIQFLFDSVQAQFEDTGREQRYRSYSEKFRKFCERNFLKFRGRSGYMLNLSEETLIFLTKVCVKDQELMRLKDVFTAFERRSVFLDSGSKEQVAQYFEKLNLIEKKSDSGDAKYVKRIL